MKICLINPPVHGHRIEGYEWSKNAYTIQHLGIGYIAGTLEKYGYETDIIEAPGENLNVKEVCKKLIDGKYDVIGMSTYFFNFINVLRIIKSIIQKLSDTFIFCGGYLPTLCPREVLDKAKGIDCCMLGEGEYTTLELVQTLERKQDWKKVAGLAYKENGEIKVTGSREPIRNLDELAFPKRVIINQNFVPLSTSRGCYGMCNFCGVREFYDICGTERMRFRSPENVVAEMEDVYKRYQPKIFMISDETFFSGSTKRRDWLETFYTLLKEKNLPFKFHALARANDVLRQKDIILKLREVGLVNVFIGVESFVQRQLDFYKKKTKVKDNVDSLQFLYENNFDVSMGLMMLDPFTTLDELEENIKWLRKTKCYSYLDEKQEIFSIDGPVIAIPGTELYSYLEEHGLLANNDKKYDFQDRQIAVFNDIVEQWRTYVAPVSQKFYLISKANKCGHLEVEQVLKEKKTQAMLIDIEFMEELCRRIRNNSIESDNCTEFLEEWGKCIQPVRDDFEDAKKILDGI
ncbi:MAG: B12-binding domain-containing radical SAM protein [Lachnospiraceae bacterium]|nr:B12-binding domain-containing radical SAM protein [Lachnospiraceae bacterium]